MPKTSWERQQALRARRAQDGLKRFEVWVHPTKWPQVRRYVDRLRRRGEKHPEKTGTP